MRVFLILTLSIFLIAVSASADEWETFHGAASLSGVSSSEIPATPSLLWRFDAGAPVCSTPVSGGGYIFFCNRRGEIFALNRAGQKVWMQTLVERPVAQRQGGGAKFDAPLSCFDKLVLAVSRKGKLYALDAKTGIKKWSYDMNGSVRACPNMVPDVGVIVIDQSDGVLHCVNIETGKLRWETDGVERSDGTPSSDGGWVVFGSCAAALHIYSASDGTHIGDIEIDEESQIAGGVAISKDSVFAGTYVGALVRADLKSMKIVWRNTDAGDQSFATPAVTDDKVIFSADDGFVRALDRATGKQIWKFDTAGLPTSPVVANGKVLVSADGVLFLLSIKDGRKIWSNEISDEITSPAVVDGMIIVGADDGTVTAFGKKDER